MLMAYLTSIFLITNFYPHLLLTLMSLEIMMISSILPMFYILLLINFEYFIMIIIPIIICEGILGLTILIMIIQFKGKGTLNSMNMMI
uniref:NADH dehydrogenase subunit 4L n=1 Tax=Leptopilina syphax TaxID=2755057 RepID=A0A7D6JA01_9HYME|nr:NADH dehydrogenase subunit 4L [Leptopilina syphax]